VNPEYQHFVAYMLDMPKFQANTITAINHWQVQVAEAQSHYHLT